MPHAAVLPVIRSAVTPGTGWELFNPLSLSPLVYFDTLGGSMLDSGGAAASHGDNVAVLDDLAESSVALVLPGVAYNYASVPDSAALDITGDLDLRAKITLESFTPAADGDLIAKYITTGNQRAFRLLVNTSGQLHFIHSPTGSGFSGNTATSSVALPTDNPTLWVRAIKSESLKNVTFFTSTDGENWSQLGVPQSITSGTTFSSSAFLEVGSNNGGINPGFPHGIHRVQIFASTDGTDKRLDIDFTAQTAGATSFTAATGQTVTINQSGDYPARIGGTSYAAQSTDSLRPVALTETGLYLPGVANNDASVSNTGFDIPEDDFDLIIKGLPVSILSGSLVCGHENTPTKSWFLRIDGSGIPTWMASSDGANLNSIAATTGITESVEFDLRFLRNGTTSTFYTRPSGSDTWTQLGGAVADTVAPYDAGHTTFRIGALDGIGYEGVQNFYCKGITIYNGGATVLDIDFTNTADAHGATSITATTGQTVTINQSGDDPATLIRFAVPRGDGSDDYMTATGITTATAMTAIIVFDMVGAGESAGRLLSGFADAAAETGAGGFYLARVTTTDNLAAYSHTGTVIGTATNGATGKHIATITVEDGSQAFRLDGASIGTGSEAGDTEIENLAVWSASNGGTNTAADIPMVFLVNRVLTTAEIEKAEAYWASANRYDITLA